MGVCEKKYLALKAFIIASPDSPDVTTGRLHPLYLAGCRIGPGPATGMDSDGLGHGWNPRTCYRCGLASCSYIAGIVVEKSSRRRSYGSRLVSLREVRKPKLGYFTGLSTEQCLSCTPPAVPIASTEVPLQEVAAYPSCRKRV